MAHIDDHGQIVGGKVAYHSERCLEALEQAAHLEVRHTTESADTLGPMLDTLAYDHAKGAARAVLNRKRKGNEVRR